MGRSKAPSLPIKALSFCRPTELRGKGGGASHQRGECISNARRAAVKVLAAKGGIKKWRRRRHTSPVERYFIPPEGGALNPSGRRQPIPDRTLGAQGQRPGGAINPRPRKRASTFGNTGKHRPGPNPDRAAARVQRNDFY